jgi:dihydroorotate dehydrogenase electron transfer subunit
MANWEKGEEVDLIGPLGNYWKGLESCFPIIIGGGVGIAPILNLHHLLLEKQIDHSLIMGARHKGEHFLKHEPQNKIFLSTDDGSLGIEGNVVDALISIYPNSNHPHNTKIFSCGPPMMMEGVRNYSLENQLECDFALETIMACGIGICQGCTVERKVTESNSHSYRNRFALACMDGPIFSGREIISCM